MTWWGMYACQFVVKGTIMEQGTPYRRDGRSGVSMNESERDRALVDVIISQIVFETTFEQYLFEPE